MFGHVKFNILREIFYKKETKFSAIFVAITTFENGVCDKR